MTRPNSKVARGGKWRRVVRHDPPLPVQEVVFDFAVTAPSPNPGSERRTDQQHGQRHAVRYVRLTAQNLDMCGALGHVRFMPIADMFGSLDYLIGARKHRLRHGKSQRLSARE
jgi:hypothetical protein